MVDDVIDGDSAVREITIATWRDLSEGKPAARNLFGQRNQGVFDFLCAVNVALAGFELAAKPIGIEPGHRAIDVDGSEVIPLALFDRDGDRVSVLVRIEISDGGDNLEVGVAAIEVETAKQLFIERGTILIVNVATVQEAQEVGTLRVDNAAKTTVAKSRVPDEHNLINLGAVAFVHIERDVHAPLIDLFDAACHSRAAPADPRVSLFDRRYIAGDGARVIGATGIGLRDLR